MTATAPPPFSAPPEAAGGLPETTHPAAIGGRPSETAGRSPELAALASAIERLLSDAALRRRLSGGASELAALHSWERVAAAHREMYSELLRPGER